jgi:hypothetical protein
MKNEFHEVYVCVDCVQFHVNGEVNPEFTDAEYHWFLNTVEGEYHLGDREKDNEFAIEPCESCNSHLAGARFHMFKKEL